MKDKKLKTINLEQYLTLAIKNSEEYLSDSDYVDTLKEVLSIIKKDRFAPVFVRKGSIKVKTTDIPLFKEPTELLLTANVSSIELRDKILLLLRAKNNVKEDEEEVVVDSTDELDKFIEKFRLLNPDAKIEKITDGSVVKLGLDTPIRMLRIPDEYHLNDDDEVLLGDKVIISTSIVKEAPVDDNTIVIPNYDLSEEVEEYEDKLKKIYDKYGYKTVEKEINGVTIRGQYPHEAGIKSIVLDGIKYNIDSKCHPDYYKTTYSDSVLKKIIKSITPSVKGLEAFVDDIIKLSSDENFTFPYPIRSDIDVDRIQDLLNKTVTERTEDDKDYEITVSDIPSCPALISISYKFTISDKHKDELITLLGKVGKVSTREKKKVDKHVIEVRKRKADESIEDYESYLMDNYRDHGILFAEKSIRFRYPHEKVYSKEPCFKIKGEKYIIKYEDGTTSKDYNDYYLNDYLKTKVKKDIEIVSSKKGFLKDVRKIKSGLQTTISKFRMSELQNIIDIISNDDTSEITEEESNDISFSGYSFIPFINKEYLFKVNDDTLSKLNSLTYINKYFNGLKISKSKEPLKSIIRIKKRKGESLEEYEAYLEGIYSDYPSLLNKDSDGNVITPRNKLPHELFQRQFVVDGKIVEIQYGNPDDPEDMEEFNKDKERYISSVREFYDSYYKSFRTKIDSIPKIEKNKEDFLEILKEVFDNKDNLSVVNVKTTEIEKLINLLSEDHTKQDAINNAYFLKVSGANLVYKSNLVFQFTISEDTYNKALPIINKYFGTLKHGHKNIDKNYYIKKKLEERLANIPERRDAIINKQKELIEKALDILKFDATKETDLVELVGAVITRSKKDEFLSIMQQIEATGFKLDDFVPIEMPPKYDGSNPVKYERDLVDRYRFVRPEYYDEDSKEKIFDTVNGRRAPYPHEMFKWTDDNQPSISSSNNESEYYRYYVDYGNNALMRKRKVTNKEDIKDKPKLLGKLREKITAIKDKFTDVPVIGLLLNNDVLRAMKLEDESFRDVNVSTTAYNAFTEKLFKYSVIGAGVIFFTPVTLVPGIVGIGAATVGHQMIDGLIRIRNCYDYIKVSKCEEYNTCLEELTKDIVSLEKQVMAIDEAPQTESSASRKKDLLDNLKSKIVSYRKTHKKFNEAFAKLSKKTIKDWQDEEEKYRDIYQGLVDKYPEAARRGGMSL